MDYIKNKLIKTLDKVKNNRITLIISISISLLFGVLSKVIFNENYNIIHYIAQSYAIYLIIKLYKNYR